MSNTLWAGIEVLFLFYGSNVGGNFPCSLVSLFEILIFILCMWTVPFAMAQHKLTRLFSDMYLSCGIWKEPVFVHCIFHEFPFIGYLMPFLLYLPHKWNKTLIRILNKISPFKKFVWFLFVAFAISYAIQFQRFIYVSFNHLRIPFRVFPVYLLFYFEYSSVGWDMWTSAMYCTRRCALCHNLLSLICIATLIISFSPLSEYKNTLVDYTHSKRK